MKNIGYRAGKTEKTGHINWMSRRKKAIAESIGNERREHIYSKYHGMIEISAVIR